MRRRDFIQFLSGAMIAAPCGAAAQTAPKTYRLATLNPRAPITANSLFGRILVRELAQHGYRLGRNLAFNALGADGNIALLPQLARELVTRKVDAVVASNYPTAVALKPTGLATVIVAGAGDPVATGLIDGLSRPGGNITGISDDATTLTTKRLGLLKGALPNLRKVAMLWNKNDHAMTLRYEASAKAAVALGVTVQPLGVGEPNDFDDAFAAMNREPPDAILMVSDTLAVLNRKRVFDYAATRRVPAIYENDSYVRDGGLMSYGADLNECYTRAASLVARIFKGAKPADLPFELPTRYLFVINLKTAKSIGLELPPMLLALADEVIE
jgi:putative tryptophan/tyrosine transport system substrate-binding protein